jgi:hypothetical protein
MAKERKKAVVKPVVKPIVPKKRETVEEVKPVEVPIEEPKAKEEKRKKTDFKTIRVASNADIEERKHISDRVQKGELTLAYYAVDGDNSYHYYYINKN